MSIRYIVCVIGSVLALSGHGAPYSAHTETVGLDIDAVAFRPLTLTFSLDNLRLREFLPDQSNLVAHVAAAHLSLSMLRAFFLWQWYVDECHIDGMYFRVLQRPDGRLSLFSDGVNTQDIVTVFGGEVRAEKTRETARSSIRLPQVTFTNITVVCSNAVTQTHLWSMDDAAFSLRNVRIPVERNREMWFINASSYFNRNTGQYMRVGLALRTWPRAPYLHMQFSGRRITAAVWDIFYPESAYEDKDYKEDARRDMTAQGATVLFTGAWARLSAAIETEFTALKEHTEIREYFATTPRERIASDIYVDITISNAVFRPGMCALHFYTDDAAHPSVSLVYAISNTPQMLYPQRVAFNSPDKEL